MKEIEQIKMRKDIFILNKKYNIPCSSIAKSTGVVERTIRDFLSGRNLSKKNFHMLKESLLNIQQELKEAEKYKGFNYD